MAVTEETEKSARNAALNTAGKEVRIKESPTKNEDNERKLRAKTGCETKYITDR